MAPAPSSESADDPRVSLTANRLAAMPHDEAHRAYVDLHEYDPDLAVAVGDARPDLHARLVTRARRAPRPQAPRPDARRLHRRDYRDDWRKAFARWRRGEMRIVVEIGDDPPDIATGRMRSPDHRSETVISYARPIALRLSCGRTRERRGSAPRRRGSRRGASSSRSAGGGSSGDDPGGESEPGDAAGPTDVGPPPSPIVGSPA